MIAYSQSSLAVEGLAWKIQNAKQYMRPGTGTDEHATWSDAVPERDESSIVTSSCLAIFSRLTKDPGFSLELGYGHLSIHASAQKCPVGISESKRLQPHASNANIWC